MHTRLPLRILLIATVGCVTACNNGRTDSPPPAEQEASGASSCSDLPDKNALESMVRTAPDSGEAGGLFHGRQEWAAVVNRSGEVCVIVVGDSMGKEWPASRNIALAKAFTANGLSTDTLALSTARLYTLSQPGYALYGAGAANPFNPECLAARDVGGKVCGGTIVFGGGLPLYANGHIVGGLGLSGDTPCADHEIAKRVRAMAGLMPTKGNFVDDIVFLQDGASVFAHPLCQNTWRNKAKVGDAHPPAGYPAG